MMLGRLQRDCELYFGFGHRNPKKLSEGDEQKQISEMLRLYSILPEKPVWCTAKKIIQYARRMGVRSITNRK